MSPSHLTSSPTGTEKSSLKASPPTHQKFCEKTLQSLLELASQSRWTPGNIPIHLWWRTSHKWQDRWPTTKDKNPKHWQKSLSKWQTNALGRVGEVKSQKNQKGGLLVTLKDSTNTHCYYNFIHEILSNINNRTSSQTLQLGPIVPAFTHSLWKFRYMSSLFLLSENVQNYWNDTTMISVACRTYLKCFVLHMYKTTFCCSLFTTFQEHMGHKFHLLANYEKCLPTKKLTFWSIR